MACCGPKLSICCTLLSVWGVIMLVILGYLLKMQSIAFVEDLGIKENENHTRENLLEEMKERFDVSAFNCWLAAGLYGATFLISVHQFYYNMKKSHTSI